VETSLQFDLGQWNLVGLETVLIVIGLAIEKFKGIVIGLLFSIALDDLVELLRDRNAVLLENNQLLSLHLRILRPFRGILEVDGPTDDLQRLAEGIHCQVTGISLEGPPDAAVIVPILRDDIRESELDQQLRTEWNLST
jgi:hypothetical protein